MNIEVLFGFVGGDGGVFEGAAGGGAVVDVAVFVVFGFVVGGFVGVAEVFVFFHHHGFVSAAFAGPGAGFVDGAVGVGEVAGVREGGLRLRGAVDGILEGFREAGEGAADRGEEGAGGLEEFPGVEERDGLDTEAEDDEADVGRAAGDGPAGEVAGAKKKGEEREEDEHAGEEGFPFLEPFFGVREEVANEGERGDHDEDVDGGGAEGDGDEGGEDGDNRGEDHAEEEPDGARANGDGDAKGGASRASSEGAINAGGGDVDFGAGAGGDGGLFDAFKNAGQGDADDVAEVDGDFADDEGEVHHDGGDDDAREGALDVVVAEAEAGDLGEDDDEDEDDEDEVRDAAAVFPDDSDGVEVFVFVDGGEDEEVGDEAVEIVHGFREGVRQATDDPGAGADFVVAGGGGFGGVVDGFDGGDFGGVGRDGVGVDRGGRDDGKKGGGEENRP